jgi:hypothetical protein
MTEHHDSGAALEEYKKYLDELERAPIRPEMMRSVGLDQETGYPIKRAEFELVPSGQIVLDVPDRYLENPSIDSITGRRIWVLPISEEFQRAAAGQKNDIVLRAAGTGRKYHLANTQQVPLPQSGGSYREFYNHIANVYAASGVDFSKLQNYMALIGNGPYPVHNLRPVNSSAQTLHIGKDHFEGLLSHRLVGFDRLASGIIIRDDNLRLKTGQVRMQEKDKSFLSGWEFEAEITDIQAISMEDIFNFSAEDLGRYGFRTNDEAIDYFCSLFTRQKKDPRQSKNKAWAIALGNISPDDPERGIMYFKPDERIFSRFSPTY